MRAPISDLPVVFDGVSLRAGGATILDRITHSSNPARRPWWSGRTAQAKAACCGFAWV